MTSSTASPGSSGTTGEHPPADREVKPPRRRHRAAWLLAAAVVATLVAGGTAQALVPRLLEQHATTQHSWSARITSVVVNGDGAGVTLVPGPAGHATVRQRLRWSFRRPQVSEQVQGGVLQVSVSCSGVTPLLGSCSTDLTLTVPAAATVTADVGAGSVDARGLSGALALHVTSGAIEGEALHAAQVDATAGSGSVELGFAVPPHRVTARSGAGPVEVDLPAGTHYAVDARSTAGPVSVDDGLERLDAPDQITAVSAAGPVDVSWG